MYIDVFVAEGSLETSSSISVNTLPLFSAQLFHLRLTPLWMRIAALPLDLSNISSNPLPASQITPEAGKV